MRRMDVSRKARFKAALALSGMQRQEWAKQAGVTNQHLGAVLRNEELSKPLTEKIDAFINEVSGRLMLAAS